MSNPDDLLTFIDDAAPPDVSAERPAWRILVVDDDRQVHAATRFALTGLTILDRPLELIHAYSAGEAVAELRRESDIGVILLDVVMETPSAGLDIISVIRDELALGNIRIILRTGQPGYAPEIDTVRRYDINDYKSKSELTRNKLFTALSSALRTYDQLCRLDANRRSLECIVSASRQLMSEQDMARFSINTLAQMADFLGVAADGVICTDDAGRHPPMLEVLAGVGRHAGALGQSLTGGAVAERIQRSLVQRCNLIDDDGLALYLSAAEGSHLAAFLHLDRPVDVDRNLLEVFCSNIALGGENVRLLERLRGIAYVDTLTGLANRAALIEALDNRFDELDSEDRALALVDIDQFTAVNDMFGHQYGDQLLNAVAQRLRRGLPENCFVARVSNDVFAIAGAEADVSPELLGALFHEPLRLNGIEHAISVTIGVVRAIDSTECGADRLKDAWIALGQAKEGSNGRAVYFTAAAGRLARERTHQLSALRHAFSSDRLYLVYQPQIDLASLAVVGVEALLRWQDEDGSFVPPDRFIPIAESSGLIVELGAWVLRTALLAGDELRCAGHDDLVMAVNVSAGQFSHPDFLDMLDGALAASAAGPSGLELEITESVAIMDPDAVERILHAIKQRGISVAIDDFGTGYSSLSYLDRLPADRIKIDRSFVNALGVGERGARIAEMVIPLGRQLGMKVLAEGIETEEQAARLRRLGCHEAQGYLYARPMRLPDLLGWLAEHKEKRA